MTSFLTDVAYAVRTFAKRPAFAVTAIGTLALGIGATMAIFGVVNAVLLRPLPYQDPGKLVYIWEDMRNRSVTDFPWPPADFADLRAQASRFESVAALTTGRQVFVGSGGSDGVDQVRTGAATPNLFRLLGARMAIGSDFTEADGTPPPPQPQSRPNGSSAQPRTSPRTILSYQFWQRRFGADPRVVGRVVRLGDHQFDVIGVLEPGFELLFPPNTNVERVPDIWTPLRVDFAAGSRMDGFLRVIGRLKPDVSLADAQGEVDAFAADLRARFPIKQTSGVYLRVERMDTDLVSDVRASIVALMGAVTFVLLISCANVASLLLVRAAARERELAVRAALGSSRWRLVQQMLAESLVIALVAVLTGLGLSWLGIRLLIALGPADLPRLDHVRIDPMVVSFGVVVGILSAVVFSLLPAVRASRPAVMDLVRRAGRMTGPGSGSVLRNAVVVIEVTLSCVLLVGSGLMIRSFVALQRAKPGYDARNVLTFLIPNVRIPDPQARRAFMRDLGRRLEAMPGVQGATAASPFPLDGRIANARWGLEEALANPSKFQQATMYVVLPGFFETMRTRLIEGRTFAETDNSPDARVIVIDRILAAKAFHGQSAVGRTLLARIRTPEPERFQVIGVVDHQRHESLAADGREAMYVADAYLGYGVANRWAVRTIGDPLSLAHAVRALVTELSPRSAAIEVQPMDVFADHARAQTRFALALIGVFAAIALLLTAVGLYSVLSTAVRQRTPEIGVRMAFGAGYGSILGMMVGHGLRLSAVGIACGVVVAAVLTRLMRTMLVGVEPTDLATFATMIVCFIILAIIACGVPAARAARLDPMVALRGE